MNDNASLCLFLSRKVCLSCPSIWNPCLFPEQMAFCGYSHIKVKNDFNFLYKCSSGNEGMGQGGENKRSKAKCYFAFTKWSKVKPVAINYWQTRVTCVRIFSTTALREFRCFSILPGECHHSPMFLPRVFYTVDCKTTITMHILSHLNCLFLHFWLSWACIHV